MAIEAFHDIYLAYISAKTFEGLGACGGLLLVNHTGRPVEFHCTSPVTTSRTQEILFGQSLPKFLFCEQIARALADELKQKPTLFLTNVPELIELGTMTETPVVYVRSPASGDWESDRRPLFELDGRAVYLLHGDESVDGIETKLRAFHRAIPIDEPFERIAQALEEAHAVVR
ncbi:MAG: hypothetical protein ABL888_08705 [Pirellulaceae bacterium]